MEENVQPSQPGSTPVQTVQVPAPAPATYPAPTPSSDPVIQSLRDRITTLENMFDHLYEHLPWLRDKIEAEQKATQAEVKSIVDAGGTP